MTYDFKLLEEAAWAATIAALVFGLTAVASLGDVDSWQTWAVALAIGCARAAAGGALAVLARRRQKGATP